MAEDKDDLQDMADVLGAEHFPQCPCFQSAGRGVEERMNMYVTAQEYANGFVGNMVVSGTCLEAMPYFIALFTNMCNSMIASHVVSTTVGPGITMAGSQEFSRVQHELLDKIRERQDALMRRADRLAFGMGEGTDSVQ